MEKLHLLVATVVLCGVVQEALSAVDGPTQGINLLERGKRKLKNLSNEGGSGKGTLSCFNNVVMQLFNVLKKHTDCRDANSAVKRYEKDMKSEIAKYKEETDQTKMEWGISMLTTQGKAVLQMYTTCLGNVKDAKKKTKYAKNIKGSVDRFDSSMTNCEGGNWLSGHVALLGKAL